MRSSWVDLQTELNSLNLSKNMIKQIENISGLSKLQTLLLGHNCIATAAACEQLRNCPSITTLDLQENKIEDPEILDELEAMPNLAVLYLMGNPCVKKIRHYRKQVIGRCKGLKYLDDRPVFEEERLRCDVWYAAFKEQGEQAANAAERAEMDRQRVERIAKEERNFQAFAEFVRRSAEERAAATGEELEDGDEDRLPSNRDIPGLENEPDDDDGNNSDIDQQQQSDNSTSTVGAVGQQPPQAQPAAQQQQPRATAAVNAFSGERIVHTQESDEARQAREERLARIREYSDQYRERDDVVSIDQWNASADTAGQRVTAAVANVTAAAAPSAPQQQQQQPAQVAVAGGPTVPSEHSVLVAEEVVVEPPSLEAQQSTSTAASTAPDSNDSAASGPDPAAHSDGGAQQRQQAAQPTSSTTYVTTATISEAPTSKPVNATLASNRVAAAAAPPPPPGQRVAAAASGPSAAASPSPPPIPAAPQASLPASVATVEAVHKLAAYSELLLATPAAAAPTKHDASVTGGESGAAAGSGAVETDVEALD